MASRVLLIASSLGAAICIAACSGQTSQVPHDTLQSSFRQNVRPTQNCIASTIEVLTDSTNGQLMFYNDGQTSPCEVIQPLKAPQGLAHDLVHDIYDANFGGARVLKFKPDYLSKPGVGPDPSEEPLDPAACKGYLALTNFQALPSGPGSVSIFKKLAIVRKIHDSTAKWELFAACDPSGNLYTDGQTSASVTVVNEWAGGTGKAVELTNIASFVKTPGGMRWANGKLWILDQNLRQISIWSAPWKSPIKVITLSGAVTPVSFGLNSTATQILVADAGLDLGVFYNLGGSPTGHLTPFSSGGTIVGADYSNGI